MPKASFTLDGIQGLTDALTAYDAQVRARIVIATHVTRENVVARAQANAPKDKGDLARAIQGRGTKSVQLVGLVDEDIPSRGGKNTAHRNPSVYGPWYEFGFKTRRISAHPFMGPAVDAEQQPHIDRLTDAINGVAF